MSARLSIRTVAVRGQGEDRRRAGHDNEENAMKQYLLSVHHVGDFPTPAPEVMQEMFAQVEEFNEQLRRSGAWVFAGGLQPRESSTTVRYKQGQTLVTDGPFRGDQGAARRLLGRPGSGPRRGARAGQTRRRGVPGRRRGAPVPGRVTPSIERVVRE
jgi:hypothetical protein